jgi:hypothetical protein
MTPSLYSKKVECGVTGFNSEVVDLKIKTVTEKDVVYPFSGICCEIVQSKRQTKIIVSSHAFSLRLELDVRKFWSSRERSLPND